MSDKKHQEELLAKRRVWKAHIQAWSKSGLTQNEYCRSNNLKVKNFWYWKKKFNTKQEPPSFVSFVPVPVTTKKSQKISSVDYSGLSLLLNDNIEIRVSNEFNARTLVKVVSTLGR